jgi:hypothetical protein
MRSVVNLEESPRSWAHHDEVFKTAEMRIKVRLFGHVAKTPLVRQ